MTSLKEMKRYFMYEPSFSLFQNEGSFCGDQVHSFSYLPARDILPSYFVFNSHL